MRWLTRDAVLACAHETGLVGIVPSQEYVTIEGRSVLVEPDPVARPIVGCVNANPPMGIKPCLTTLAVEAGYSEWIRIDGRRVCLDTLTGLTDGTPPGTHRYRVRHPGQDLVAEGR
jgi:hypothetical protein